MDKEETVRIWLINIGNYLINEFRKEKAKQILKLQKEAS